MLFWTWMSKRKTATASSGGVASPRKAPDLVRAEWGSGGAVSVEQAEIDCWETTVDLLQADGYSPAEIVEAVR